jgi:glycosyltransferase involved in cell wall biosynthesis
MISIITPSFNRAYIIDETAQSVLNQSDDRWEWVVVDDGSTDESWQKLQAYALLDHRVRVFRRDRAPKGACTCRNIGAENARGEFLIFLDTDDLLGKDAIKHRLAEVQRKIVGVLPYFPIVTFEADPKEGFWWDDKENPVSWLTGLFTMTPPCQGTAPVWPRDEFLRIGGWREDLRVWQDVELHIRAYVEGLRFEAVPDAVPDVFLRLSPDSISHVNFHSLEKARSRADVVHYCLSTFSASSLSEIEVSALQSMVLGVYINALNARDFAIATSLLESFAHSPFANDLQISWMRSAKRHWRYRLYKCDKLKRMLERKKILVFPFKMNRTLGGVKWEQKNTINE